MGKTNLFHHQPTDPIWHTTYCTLGLRRKTSLLPHVFCAKQRNEDKITKIFRMQCGVGVYLCFRVYHTKLHFWRLFGTTLEKQNAKHKYFDKIIILLRTFNWWNKLAKRVLILLKWWWDKLMLFWSIFRYFCLIFTFFRETKMAAWREL
jgi:hypothetical protein